MKTATYCLCLLIVIATISVGSMSVNKANAVIVKIYGSDQLKKDSISKNSIPVLCYHQVRDRRGTDSKSEQVFIIPPGTFAAQIKMLHDSGFSPIPLSQYLNYINGVVKLPKNPVVLTFDDGTISQYENALPVLNKYGYTATFFIMTVALNKVNFMSEEQVRQISRTGNTIGCHTWDHHKVTDYSNEDWVNQVMKPRAELEQITGSPVVYFAYPYGAWDEIAISKLREYGFRAALQLSGKMKDHEFQFTIPRILVDGSWDANHLYNVLKKYRT